MLLECQNCGAPLDVGPAVTVVQCRYCGRSNQVGAARTVAPQTPPGWRPPPVWTPPQHFPAPSVPIRYARGNAVPAVLFAAIGAATLIGVVAIYAVTGAVRGTAASPAARPGISSPAQRWDGKSTLECGLGQEVVIENRTVTLSQGPVVRANMSCKLTIRGCTLKAPKIIEASQNTRIVIENSTLDGAQGVVDGSQLVELHVEKNSKLVSNETAIDVSQNSKIYLVDSSVESKDIAIKTSQLSRVDAQGSTIIGKTAIETGQMSKVVLRGTQVSGGRKLGPSTTVEQR